MIPQDTRRQFGGMALYTLVALLLIVLRLVPGTAGSWDDAEGLRALILRHLVPDAPGSTGLPGPDLLLCLSFAWVLRRPHEVPAPLIALMGLIDDFVTMRPPGLWALILLLGTEAARKREHRWREHSFLVEWLRVAILMTAMLIGARVVLMLAMQPTPPLWQMVLKVIATIAAYPVVVVLARWILRLRRATPAEIEMQR